MQRRPVKSTTKSVRDTNQGWTGAPGCLPRTAKRLDVRARVEMLEMQWVFEEELPLREKKIQNEQKSFLERWWFMVGGKRGMPKNRIFFGPSGTDPVGVYCFGASVFRKKKVET